MMTVRPITIRDAKSYVDTWHRHNQAPVGGIVAVSAVNDDAVVGVGILGRPVARALDDGVTAEVTRVATDGTLNACSMIYGALTRAAKALGYRRIYTYTLAEEPGASLRAAGWTRDAELRARPTWDTPSRRRNQTDDNGVDRRPPGPKVRWIKELP